MTSLVAAVARWIAFAIGSFVMVLAILLLGRYLAVNWAEFTSKRAEIPRLELLLDKYRTELARIEGAIAQRQSAWEAEQAVVEKKLNRELSALESNINRLKSKNAAVDAEYLRYRVLAETASKLRIKANEARKKHEDLERDYWWWDTYIDPQKMVDLKKARAAAETAEFAAKGAEAARDKKLAGLPKSVSLDSLLSQQSAKRKQIENLKSAIPTDITEMKTSKGRLVAESARFERELAELRASIASDPREKLRAVIGDTWKSAAAIVIGILLMPVAIKVALFYGFAPLAGKLRPIQILPSDEAPDLAPPRGSAVSIQVDLNGDEELLVHSDFLQSSNLSAKKQTQWFLNPKIPFSSIASGMFALTRVSPAGEGTGGSTRVTVSPQKDPLGEVGMLEIPKDGAMVIQPRSLAGIVKPRGVPVQISRHWRLASLHAWLTLQLRYLVIHGPCKLILKGCRGVRAESPSPDAPRVINQAATLGFSANLVYSNTRCETFVSYLTGKEDLFNDLFSGGPGRFVYEEMPASGRKTGITGRGLEGALDASLKVFGI